jgi:hypothetical protein
MKFAGFGMNWANFEPQNPIHQKVVIQKLNSYLSAPQQAAERIAAKVQEYTTKDGTPDMFDAINVLKILQSDVVEFDFGWKEGFEVQDMRQTSKSSFDIMDLTSGLTFEAVAEGMEAKIYGVSGDKTTVPMSLYGGGLAFSQIWWDDQEFYKVEQQARDFRSKYYKAQATIAYGLLDDTTNDVAFATNDQTTINNAISELINDNFGSLPVTGMEEFVIYCNPKLKQRIAAALNSVVAYTAEKQLLYSVKLVSTPFMTSTTYYWVVLPGLKNQWGERQDLVVLDEVDIYRYAKNVVGWGRYGGAINTDQIRRCALA